MKTFILCMLVSFFVPPMAFGDQKGPCGNDGPKLCPDANFGKGGMFNCLVMKKHKASKGCQEHLNRLLTHKRDCQKDIAAFCEGKPFYCLMYPSAGEYLSNKASRRCLASVLLKAEYLSECRKEINQGCSDVTGTPSALVGCLKSLKKKSKVCAEELIK